MIEISHDLEWQFRINEKHPRALDRRENKSGARWTHCWQWHTTEAAAKRALLTLAKDDDDDE